MYFTIKIKNKITEKWGHGGMLYKQGRLHMLNLLIDGPFSQWGSPGGSLVKNLSAMQETWGSIPG